MNIQQLEYVVAVDEHRHFAKAAEKSFVTQPTLSTMIQKLEEELSIKIFDRNQHPVVPTREGEEIIRRTKRVLAEVNGLKKLSIELRGETGGELHIGIIPTLAPYLLPLFLKSFREKNPSVVLFIKELTTDDIISGLKREELDLGLLATPLHDAELVEHNLFNEELFAYASGCTKISGNKPLSPKEIDFCNLWVMEEGHCLRNQVFNLCKLNKWQTKKENLHYQAGSIETLINMVDSHNGMAIIPEMASFNLKPSQREKVHRFEDPKPVREISLVVTKEFPRKRLLKLFMEEIKSCVPFEMESFNKTILGINSLEVLAI